MCEPTTYSKSGLSTYGRTNKFDPTRTIALRAKFVSDMNKGFNELRGLVRQAIVERDVLGLKDRSESHPTFLTVQAVPPRHAFNFPRSGDKVAAFMAWFRSQALVTIERMPQYGAGIQHQWTNMYVADSYKRGVMRARYEMRAAGYTVPTLEQSGGIDAIMSTPFHADRVGVLYSRVFSELKGITGDMDKQVSTILGQGLIDGDGPALLARKLNRTISGPAGNLGITDTLGRFIPAQRRAMILARTEIIRAHHMATIQEYRNYEVAGVRVRAEWTTAGDDRVCGECMDLEMRVYPLDEIEKMIPLHPQCRCIALPASPELVRTPAERAAPIRSLPANPIQNVRRRGLMHSADTFAACIRQSGPIGAYSSRPTPCKDLVFKGGKWTQGGKPVSPSELDRIKKLGIPPGWRDVVVAANPKAELLAIGMDSKGRWVYKYSQAAIDKKAAQKFVRTRNFASDVPKIRSGIETGVNNNITEAYLLKLEHATAIRAGSTADRAAKVKAYGLTTFQHEHVTIRGNKIIFEFIAKKGVPARYELTDPVLAKWLGERKAATKVGQMLFPDTSAGKVNAYLRQLAGGKSYSIKDFRTYHATRIAKDELRQYSSRVLTEKQRKEIINRVSTTVSEFLHNTPKMALESYIDPMVWEIIGGLK